MRILPILLAWAPFLPSTADHDEQIKSARVDRTKNSWCGPLEQGRDLKKRGHWEEHCQLAEAAIQLARQRGNLPEEAELSTQLASTAFYKGDYGKTAELAVRAKEIYLQLDNRSGIAASLYLFSAALRGQKNFAEAERLAREALDFCGGDALLEGKVRFNLAAALMDREEPLVLPARQELELAYSLFLTARDEDYLGRTSLRLAKAYVLENEGEKALRLLEDARPFARQERVLMHFSFVRAQALAALNRKEEALVEGKTALTIAEKLGAVEDLKRIQTWLLKPDFVE